MIRRIRNDDDRIAVTKALLLGKDCSNCVYYCNDYIKGKYREHCDLRGGNRMKTKVKYLINLPKKRVCGYYIETR